MQKDPSTFEKNKGIVKQEECVEQAKGIDEQAERNFLLGRLETGNNRSMKENKNLEGGNIGCSNHLADIKSVWTCRFCGRSARGHLNHTCLYCFSPL